MSEIKILDSTSSNDLKNFLLNLSEKTLLDFNYFGNISETNIDTIVDKELNRRIK